MGLPAFLGVAALLFGVVGLGRAVTEFGSAGLIAYSKLVLGPAAIVVGFLLFAPVSYGGEFPRSYFPSNQALKSILVVVAIITGLALAMSSLFGVAWLVAK